MKLENKEGKESTVRGSEVFLAGSEALKVVSGPILQPPN